MTDQVLKNAFGRPVTLGRRGVAATATSAAWRCWRTCVAQVTEWRNRARSRRELRMLNDRELSDIRLSRLDAGREAEKPFWSP